MEADLWYMMRRKLGPLGDLQRIENTARSGMPDVNVRLKNAKSDWWVELKWLAGWPRDESEVVRFPKYRKEQRIWIRRRHYETGASNIVMLAQVGHDYYVWNTPTCIHGVGFLSQARLREQAVLYQLGAFPTDALADLLRSNPVRDIVGVP